METLTTQSRLALEYQATGSTAAIARLAGSLKKYVTLEVKKAFSVIKNSDVDHCLDFDDLLQDSFFVIEKAAATYDHRQGANFFTHLHNFHLGATLITRASKKYNFFCQSWQVLERKLNSGKSLSRRVVRRDDSYATDDAEQSLEVAEEHAKFVAFLKANIEQRDRGVIISRFRDGKTLEEIGEELSITRERVRQLEARALKKIRENYPKFFCDHTESVDTVCDPVETEVKYLKAVKAIEDSTGARIPSSVSPSRFVSSLVAAIESAGLGEGSASYLPGHGGQFTRLT